MTRSFFLILLALSVTQHFEEARADFYDGIATNREAAAEYVHRVENAIGWKALRDLRPDYMMYVAERLGQLDKLYFEPTHFVEHIASTIAVEKRFFQDLTPEQVKKYLLPYRIAYEYSSKPRWKSLLRTQIEKIAQGSDADKSAHAVLNWIAANLRCTSYSDTYLIGTRGWMDPVSTSIGKRGREPDLAVFAVGALRSIGLPARIVYTHAVAGKSGGKVWMEYLNGEKKWTPWVPTMGRPSDHKTLLRQAFRDRIPLLFANPDEPVLITHEYFAPAKYVIGSNSGFNFYALCFVHTNSQLISVIGEDVNSNPFGYGANQLGTAPIIAITGTGKRCFGLESAALQAETPVWNLVNVKNSTQALTFSEDPPPGFTRKTRRITRSERRRIQKVEE